MAIRMPTVLIVLGFAAGCAASSQTTPTHLARKIAILPVNNRTGDPLEVAGVGPIDRYVLRSEAITLADVLRSEARSQLENNGFEVSPSRGVDSALKGRAPADLASALDLAADGGLGPLCLYMEIRRWEADAPMHPKHVIVALSASLFDSSTRKVVWQVERRPSPVPTVGVVMMEAAYVDAARKVIEQVLGRLRPESPVAR